MIKLKNILTEAEKPIVVFVSGLTENEGGYESVEQQAARIRGGMPAFNVVPFKWNQPDAVIEYLEQNQPVALILYSQSVSDTKTYAAIFQPEKIFAIEPHKPPSLRGIPESNMWRHPSYDYRGAGIRGNDTPKGNDVTHVTALTYIAPLIAKKLNND